MNYLTDARIFLCLTPTKMSYSFDSLMSQAEKIFAQNPLSGHLFLFLNRDRDRMKILYWDQDGFCIWYKKQETDYHRNLVFTGFGTSANNGGIVPLEVGRMVSHSSEPGVTVQRFFGVRMTSVRRIRPRDQDAQPVKVAA